MPYFQVLEAREVSVHDGNPQQQKIKMAGQYSNNNNNKTGRQPYLQVNSTR